MKSTTEVTQVEAVEVEADAVAELTLDVLDLIGGGCANVSFF